MSDTTPAVTTSMPKDVPQILCTRCGKPAKGGAVITVMGPSTGHNHQRVVVCPGCLATFKHFMATPPQEQPMGGEVGDKQAQAERFVRKGVAQ